MADVIGFRKENCLVWDISTPLAFDGGEVLSPVFYFQNLECYFKLECYYNYVADDDSPDEYELYMVSKTRTHLGHRNIPKPFSLTTYIMCQNHSLACNTIRVGVSTEEPTFLKAFIGYYDFERINLRSTRKFQLVMIFPGKVGSTLHLQSGKGNGATSAVSDVTSDVSDSKKSLPDIESLTCELSRLQLLSKDISKLLDGDLYQDVEVKGGHETFKAHRAVLCTRSEVFLAMLQSDMLEGQTARVEVKDMESDVCKDLLHYMYSGKLPELSLEKARGLFEAADRYNVGGLMQPCAEFLTMNLTPDNACDMLVLADAHSDSNFKDSVVEYLLEKKIPRNDDIWENFCSNQPILANEVLNKFYKLQVN